MAQFESQIGFIHLIFKKNGPFATYTQTGGGRLIASDAYTIIFSVAVNGKEYQVSFDNRHIKNFSCDNTGTLQIKIAERSNIDLEGNKGCGPKLTVLKVTDTEISVFVFDKGYGYNVVDNKKLVITPSNEESCAITESFFFLFVPPFLSEQQIKNYVLSGFVYGHFQVITNIQPFINRLLLTPFRKFLPSVK